MSSTDPSALLARVGNLQSLPDSFARVDRVVGSATASARDIGEAIAIDQGMSARVLRLANSPLYAFPSRIDTVTQAVTVIGTRQIRDLALATTVFDCFAGIGHPELDGKRFWINAFATGSLARLLAISRHDANPERFFVAGMMATIGRLILAQEESARFAEALADNASGRLLHEAERRLFGFDQSAVTTALLVQWKLPPALIEAAGHVYGSIQGAVNPVDPASIHCAAFITAAYGIGSSGECLALPLDDDAWSLAGPETNRIDSLVDQVAQLGEDLTECLAD